VDSAGLRRRKRKLPAAMTRPTPRAPLWLALLAWLAQLCLPLVHASAMAASPAGMAGWCGDPARAMAVLAQLPPELREGLDPGGARGAPAVDCAQLCAATAAPGVPSVAAVVALREAGVEPAPAMPAPPCPRQQAPTPPSHGPPAQG
jgi:hypothetical protein